MKKLTKEISNCTLCASYLSHEPRPVFTFHPKSKIVIIGQAPGTVVHNTGIPWNDKSGDNLRKWMDIDSSQFYNVEDFAIIPMGFCYPGKGKSGDLPPRPECAPAWHDKLHDQLKHVNLTLLIGQYAQAYYLENKRQRNLTETVRHYTNYAPQFIPLPHPSPRNRFWMAKNPWFASEIIPHLQSRIKSILNAKN